MSGETAKDHSSQFSGAGASRKPVTVKCLSGYERNKSTMPYVRRIRPIITATCAADNCEAGFIRKTPWQKYCSERCKQRTNYDPVAQRFRLMLCVYGLGKTGYELLFAKGCWLCGMPFAEGEMAHIEHDHATQVVRGLAHGACNSIIGFAKENPELLERIAHALRRTSVSS